MNPLLQKALEKVNLSGQVLFKECYYPAEARQFASKSVKAAMDAVKESSEIVVCPNDDKVSFCSGKCNAIRFILCSCFYIIDFICNSSILLMPLDLFCLMGFLLLVSFVTVSIFFQLVRLRNSGSAGHVGWEDLKAWAFEMVDLTGHLVSKEDIDMIFSNEMVAQLYIENFLAFHASLLV